MALFAYWSCRTPFYFRIITSHLKMSGMPCRVNVVMELRKIAPMLVPKSFCNNFFFNIDSLRIMEHVYNVLYSVLIGYFFRTVLKIYIQKVIASVWPDFLSLWNFMTFIYKLQSSSTGAWMCVRISSELC